MMREGINVRTYAYALIGAAVVAGAAAIAFAQASKDRSASAPEGAYVYEAEEQFYAGGVENAGTFARGMSKAGDRIVFTVNAPAAAEYEASLRYASGNESGASLGVDVNGAAEASVSLPATGGEEKWKRFEQKLALRKGLNTVSYRVDEDAADKGVNLDSLAVVGGLALAERGATVPYEELEAEAGETNAELLGPGREYLTLQAESSGRRAVRLTREGDYVQWTAPEEANSIVVRYSLPDAPGGGGESRTLSLYVDGTKRRALSLSSRYAWTYGAYPYNDDPSTGEGHRYYDESRFLIEDVPAGATVRLQRDAVDNATYYAIDLIDLERVDDPYAMPDGYANVVDFGAVPDDEGDDTGAIQDAILAAASGGKAGVWLPAGTFTLTDRLIVGGVRVRGAGMWHTVLQGTGGKGGFYGRGDNVRITDLSVRGDSVYRYDSGDDPAFVGNFGPGSLLQNVWVEHMKVGIWLNAGTDGLYMVGGRIRDTWADGVNFHAGVKNAVISHFNVRNTGDDAFAMWSAGMANENNAFRYNTSQLPMLANTFALYGGTSNRILDNIGMDTVTASAGIAVSTRDFGGTLPIAGTTEVRRNTLLRTGGLERNWNETFGALWIYADNHPIAEPVIVSDLRIADSTYDAIKLSEDETIDGVTFEDVSIEGAGAYGLDFDGVDGTGTFDNVTVASAAAGGMHNEGDRYKIVRGEGNSGW